MNIIELINKKRLNMELTYEELNYIITSYVNDSIKDYQMSAFLMAVCINGMSEEEIMNMTKIMLNSGDKLDLSSINGIKVDKHSTGGVGDKTTLVVAPLVASCSVIVPKMSGRGLGYTGGTIDKLESIPRFNVNLSDEEFINELNTIGTAVTSSSLNIDPADKKIYALRDVTGTVSSIPLIASSIMSKKLAIGADKIVLDVKVGKGALLESKEDAIKLANTMVSIGKSFNKEVVAVITNMNYPLGNNIGNALEVMEAVDTLKGLVHNNFRELCIVIATYMVSIGKNISTEEARVLVTNNLDNGKAYEKFIELVNYQHGNIDGLKVSDKVIEVKSKVEGYINNIDALKIGELSMRLGAGRVQKEDTIDYGVGIILTKNIGDYVKVDDAIAKVYISNKEIDTNEVIEAYIIESIKKDIEPLVYEIIK
jgi:pyrimidine-nucleoside phosphorylase